MPRTIKAPFNFVPLQDRVYFPEWAGQVSQDIPFSDGLSGTIQLDITAQAPIMVGAGREEGNTIEFCHTPDGRYYIPGSTIKGTLRSVLEILAYGKMTQVGPERFAIRDLSNSADGKFYRDRMTRQDPATKRTKVHCGWLRREGMNFVLDDHGLPWRLCVEDIDRQFHTHFVDFVQDRRALKQDENRRARAKYERFDRETNQQGLIDNPRLDAHFVIDDERTEKDPGKRIIVHFNQGGKPGHIVFTGQPGVRKIGNRTNKAGNRMWEGKYYEFVFPAEVIGTINIADGDKVLNDFLSVHKNSPDFLNIYKQRLGDGRPIPVFFLYDEDNPDRLHSIGLSFMYRFPTFNAIGDGIPDELKETSRHDLPELLFGYTGDDSLKGRVHCSHAFAEGGVEPMQRVGLVLSSPHPSFFPLYVGGGRSWNSGGEFKIAGRKRYPIRREVWNNSSAGTDEMCSWLRPLPAGTVFRATVRFHNLRPVELGALLASITFNNHPDCRHNIGMGKPMGYGKVQIDARIAALHSLDSTMTADTDFVGCFAAEMSSRFPGWATSPALNELYAMASYDIPADRQDDFTYMQMDVQGNNQFADAKKAYTGGEQLGLFTQIVTDTVPQAQFVGNVTAEQEQQRQQRIEQLEQQRQQRIELLKRRGEDIEAAQALKGQQLIDRLTELQQTYRGDEVVNRLLDEAQEGKAQALALANQAAQLRDERRFDEALAKYQQAETLGFDYAVLIDDCKSQRDKWLKQQNATVQEVIDQAPTGSPAAFIGRFRNRELTDQDLELMAQRVKTAVKPRDLQKKWLDPRQYQKVLGDKAQLFVDLLKR